MLLGLGEGSETAAGYHDRSGSGLGKGDGGTAANSCTAAGDDNFLAFCGDRGLGGGDGSVSVVVPVIDWRGERSNTHFDGLAVVIGGGLEVVENGV